MGMSSLIYNTYSRRRHLLYCRSCGCRSCKCKSLEPVILEMETTISCFIAGHFLFHTYAGFNEDNLVGQIPSFMLIEIEQTINYPILNLKIEILFNSFREPKTIM